MGLFDRFRKGLEKSRSNIWGRLGGWLQGNRIDAQFYDDMEEALLASDVGFDTTIWLVDQVRRQQQKERISDPKELPSLLANAMTKALSGVDSQMQFAAEGPTLVLVVGVNGVGKTTSIAKLAHHYKSAGKKVILAAGDTFRAAAIEQLMEWGARVGVDVVRQSPGSDPAAVVFDAIAAAKARGADLIICDTAGRLHNKANLMAELSKVYKVAARELPGAPHEVLLVLDAVTGQNAVSQAQVFREAVSVSGIVLTKLDGTAKGGVILPIVRELEIPVKWVGLGEQMNDLEVFDAKDFADAICSS
ncbi:signal recognition particle-docking protein FtsY [Alicyclobacillus sp. ALC3]|uniref:signal recognition particle-docking protein FtsY n=1 Tax=Alicyclobacillus sp. ALC3 TaxID=2796143 RepID=UPI0023792DEF|nr:signal recognition particle-docking protein FtsY [Alicyclobacillus sp. ALC3]WDL97387.1 signal recognition particle-docking protein FtsY [Alicyclobacillus sp. ALC3]